MTNSQVFIYMIPLLSAAAGLLTSWAVIMLLFKPEKPVDLGLFKVQGVLPRQQKQIAKGIGKIIMDEMLSSHVIKKKIMSEENMVGMKLFVEEKIDHYLHTKFPDKYPFAAFFFSRSRREKVKDKMMDEIERLTPMIIEKVIEEMEKKFDIDILIGTSVAELKPSRFKKVLENILRREFVRIILIGGGIGLVAGLLQMSILLAVS